MLAVHCQRLESHLQRRARSVSSKVSSLRSGSCTRYLDGTTVLDVYYGETISAPDFLEELDRSSEDMEELSQKCAVSEAAVAELKRQIND